MSATFKQDGDVSLRPLEIEDAEFLQQLIVNPDVRKYLGRTPMPRNLEQVEDRIKSVTEDDSIIQFIIEKEGDPVGTIALFDIDRDYRHAEFGAFMVKPEIHGKGVGTRALEMLLEYAFDELNMHKVIGGYIEDNGASRKVQEKFGFKEEGIQKDMKYRDGEYLDLVRMGLLEDEWRSR